MKIAWPVIGLILAGFAGTFGTPAWLLDIECQTFGDQCTSVIVACTYYSVQGRKVMIPRYQPDRPQSCPQVLLVPLSWPLFQWKA